VLHCCNFQYVIVCCYATEAVRRNQATLKASTMDIEKQLKEWMKFAAERDGGRRSRDLQKKITSAGGAAVAE